MLQRSESVGSSTIEDVNPSLRRVARAEAVTRGGDDPRDKAAKEAIGSIEATRLAAEIGDTAGPVTLDDLLAVHTTLMDHTSVPELGGHLRLSWVLIGGVLGGYPPPAYVAPPAESSCDYAEGLIARIDAATRAWDGKLGSRRRSAARTIAERLPEMPVFSVQGMAEELGIPPATAYRATGSARSRGDRRAGARQAPRPGSVRGSRHLGCVQDRLRTCRGLRCGARRFTTAGSQPDCHERETIR